MGFVDEVERMVWRTQGLTPHALLSSIRLRSRLASASPLPYREGMLPFSPAGVVAVLMGLNRRRRCRFPVAAAAILFEGGGPVAWSVGLNECPPFKEEEAAPCRGGCPARSA